MNITWTVIALALGASGCATSKNAATSAVPAKADGARPRPSGTLQLNDAGLRQRLAGIPNDVLREYGLYRLSPGESFAQASQNTGVRMHDLAAWNDIAAPMNLLAGQLLWIVEPSKRPNLALLPATTSATPPAGQEARQP